MKPKPKSPWGNRLAIRFFTLVLGVLIFWLLGFLMQDIRSIRGPDYGEVERRHLDPSLSDQKEDLARRLAETERRLKSLQEEQAIARDSSQNLQQTIGQLLDLRKLSLEKDVALSASDQTNLTVSLNSFLESQKQYQALNVSVSDLTAQRRQLEEEARALDEEINRQKRPAQAEFQELRTRHRLKLAALQLVMLVPLLAVGSFYTVRKRGSLYFPLWLAFSVATLTKVGVVTHEYFPSRWFNYILITVLLLAIGRLLLHFIKTAAFPKTPWLVRQYREAYERFLCPICEYPIRTGPRRFLFWTRRSAGRALPLGAGGAGQEQETYTCPSCGTPLFEACPECRQTRHSLLPHCQSCGATKEPTEKP
jgi:predicted RNA-binding Zn-ribbon protein involved in translation (DUF1610 family)